MIRQHKRNSRPNEGVCDMQHTVHSDELFVIRQHKRNGQPDQGVCDVRHAVHPNELFLLRQENRNGPIQTLQAASFLKRDQPLTCHVWV